MSRANSSMYTIKWWKQGSLFHFVPSFSRSTHLADYRAGDERQVNWLESTPGQVVNGKEGGLREHVAPVLLYVWFQVGMCFPKLAAPVWACLLASLPNELGLRFASSLRVWIPFPPGSQPGRVASLGIKELFLFGCSCSCTRGISWGWPKAL
jgi:hypothetical protein